MLIMATVFVWNIPKTIYNDHLALVALEGKNKTLSADLEWRKHSVSTTDPVFPNIIYLLQAFQIYRHAQGGAPCVVKVTAPRGRGAAMASMVAQFSSSVSGCFTFGPDMNFDLNPDLEKQATDGMVSDAIVFHAARDDKAADQLFMHLGNQTRLVRSFRLPSKPDYQLPPQKGRVYVVWLQFGANPKWNSER